MRRPPRPHGLAEVLLAGSIMATLVVAVVGPASPAAAAAPAPLRGSIDGNDLHQEVDGFGASGAFGQAGRLMAYPATDRRRVLDLLFCREQLPPDAAPRDGDGQPVCQTAGMGASVIRNQIKVCGVPGYACWKDQDLDQQWLMRQAQLRGTTRFFATPWSAPGWMKTNGTANNGGTVRPQLYAAYASYLADYALQMRDLGFPMHAISMANEPEVTSGYDSMTWNGDQLRDLVRSGIAPVFSVRGVDTKVMLPESVYWSEDKALPSLDDPAAAARLDIVAAHGYGQRAPGSFSRSKAAGKRVWQTEDSNLENGEVPNDPSIENAVDWATKIGAYLTGPEVNSWSYWWLVTEKASGEALVNLHLPTSTYTVNKRLWAMGNYSRFVRPGWRRIGVTAPASSTVVATAFKDPTSGDMALVVANDGARSQAIDLRLNGLAADELVPYTTSAEQDLQPGTPVDTSGGLLVTSVAPQTVTTFFGRARSTSALAPSVSDAIVWRGQPTEVEVQVTNLGSTEVSARLQLDAPSPLEVRPSDAVVAVPAGGTATIPVVLTADALTAAAEVPLQVTAGVAGEPGSEVTASATVRAYATSVDVCPGTRTEQVFLYSNSALVTGGPSDGCREGTARFADGDTKATYRLQVPSDTVGGSVTLTIGNQFHVEASIDGVTWRSILREDENVRDLSNKRARTAELTELTRSDVVYVRVGDSQPADGWGGFLTRLRFDVVRAEAPPPDVPEAPLPVLLVAAGAAVGGLAVRRRRHGRRSSSMIEP